MARRTKNPCSLVVVNETTGNVLRGTAAILHATSRAGGYDAYMQNFAVEVLSLHLEKQRRPVLQRIK